MALVVYEVDYSSLSQKEIIDLKDRINRFSFAGSHQTAKDDVLSFELEEEKDLASLSIPDCCLITRLL